MIRASVAHPLCAILSVLLAAPSGFAQAPAAPAPVTPSTQAPAATPVTPAVPSAQTALPAPRAPLAGTPLSIAILEGNNSVNSIPLLRSVAPVIEVRDTNDFPVEDAVVTFILPAQGPGGTFAPGGKTFLTKSDSRGQAIAPAIIPSGVGKFQIAVTAVLADRKGDSVIIQTNSDKAYVGAPLPTPSWYKKKLTWAIAGGAVAAVVLVIVLTHHKTTSNTTVVVTPGSPVFQ